MWGDASQEEVITQKRVNYIDGEGGGLRRVGKRKTMRTYPTFKHGAKTNGEQGEFQGGGERPERVIIMTDQGKEVERNCVRSSRYVTF